LGGPVEAELTTPTGAILLSNIVHSYINYYPLIKPILTGYGAGLRDFSGVANVLRLTIGEFVKPIFDECVYILETNLDDITGENIGYVIDKVMNSGAKDVSIIPIFSKKNRPGFIFRAISDSERIEMISEIIMRETGGLGIRIIPCNRKIAMREIKSVKLNIEGTNAQVRFKISRTNNGTIIRIKPEFEDVSKLAKKLSRSYISVYESVLEEIKKYFFNNI
jgi:uncharacterized protein (DUF111 family)